MAQGIITRRGVDLFRPISATGGTVTNITDDDVRYRVHTFTANGTFEVTSLGDTTGNIEYLMVAGGGSAGQNGGGGGGAGGILFGSTTVSVGSNSVVVGPGGSATVNASGQPRGGDGANTTFLGLTAIGGGSGANRDFGGNASDGGSGGGAGGGPTSGSDGFGSGTAGQGNDGGESTGNIGGSSAGGGGGGFSTAGGNASSTQGGDGGDGYFTTISGTNVGYAGGGAGSGLDYASFGGKAGSVQVGAGGGGPENGTANGRVNSGGGGGSLADGNNSGWAGGGLGGSGIVIVRYPLDEIISLLFARIDFDGYTLNQQPDDWTVENVIADVSWNVISDSSATENRALDLVVDSNQAGISVITSDEAGELEYFDVHSAVANFDPNGTNRTWGGIVYRFSKVGNIASWYQCEISRLGGTPHLRVRKFINQDLGTSASNTEDTTDLISPVSLSGWSGGDYWNIRTVYDSTETLRVKYWAPNDSEPSNFQINISDSSPPPIGKIGAVVSQNLRTDLDARWSFFEIQEL